MNERTNERIYLFIYLFIYLLINDWKKSRLNSGNVSSHLVEGFGTSTYVSFRSPSLLYLPVHSRCRGYLCSLDHTQTHTTVGRTPLDEGSARRRDLYLTTHKHSQETNIQAPGGIRTHDPSQRSATDLRFRPRGHWHRLPRYEHKYCHKYMHILCMCQILSLRE
jgi:hypothetical protein